MHAIPHNNTTSLNKCQPIGTVNIPNYSTMDLKSTLVKTSIIYITIYRNKSMIYIMIFLIEW